VKVLLRELKHTGYTQRTESKPRSKTGVDATATR